MAAFLVGHPVAEKINVVAALGEQGKGALVFSTPRTNKCAKCQNPTYIVYVSVNCKGVLVYSVNSQTVLKHS